MIKFFRRRRQKIIDEGNLTRYLIYAVEEILLVVIGILIVFQVNNWNNLQQEKSKLSEILLEVLHNINEDTSRI